MARPQDYKTSDYLWELANLNLRVCLCSAILLIPSRWQFLRLVFAQVKTHVHVPPDMRDGQHSRVSAPRRGGTCSRGEKCPYAHVGAGGGAKKKRRRGGGAGGRRGLSSKHAKKKQNAKKAQAAQRRQFQKRQKRRELAQQRRQ